MLGSVTPGIRGFDEVVPEGPDEVLPLGDEEGDHGEHDGEEEPEELQE